MNTYRLRTYRRLEDAGKLIPLLELLHHLPKDDDATEQVAGRYAQAWALTHYLWNKHPARLAAFLRAMEQSDEPDWDKLFGTYIDEDVAAVEAAVKKYVEGLP